MLDASRDEYEQADDVGGQNRLDSHAGHTAGLRQGGPHPIVILEQGGGALATVSGDGAVALQCQLHTFARLGEESVTGGWGEIVAGGRLQQFESFFAAHVSIKLSTRKREGTGFFHEEQPLFATVNDQFEPKPQENQRGHGLDRERGPHAGAAKGRNSGVALMKRSFEKIIGKNGGYRMAAHDDFSAGGARFFEDYAPGTFQTARGETLAQGERERIEMSQRDSAVCFLKWCV
jgi:hypothetical protein